ncbi:A230072I06Rik [Phodopus roborovskii]|uniref:A230072I06Rik protein n=1 Tax=Phodopus roborovskii TaxID=109678 RepID=A0AAU9Z5E1_PHORO|nr:A230072I06Rik [Phodopus roborovskii]
MELGVGEVHVSASSSPVLDSPEEGMVSCLSSEKHHGARTFPVRGTWKDYLLSGTFQPSATEKQALRQEMSLNMSPGFGIVPFSCQDPILRQL